MASSAWKYDVFLSFRGADTREGFIADLYDALVGAKIDTFRDDDELRYCQEIGPECLSAIENSRVSIVVLSKGYASSTWCLEELAHIMKCRERKMGQEVWPVFYDVDPTVVEEQREDFATAFESHHVSFKEEIVNEWRTALRDVSYLKGLNLLKRQDGHEAVIDEIVKEIVEKVDRRKLSLPMHPVALDSHVNDIVSLLDDNSIQGCIVGICGIGGIGKTTIAKKVYNSVLDRFAGSCFLENVGEISDLEGISQLRRKLLSEILQRKPEKIENVKDIGERLGCKKILIVLDDVNEKDQITKILGNPSWLFPGSRIIVTTRTKNLLETTACYRQYDVKELNKDDALQLLSLHAFNKNQPPEDYSDCAKEVVHYVGGIPLALEVLGSSLNGKDVDVSVWNDRLKKLKVISNQKVQKVLEISYDSLDDDAVKFLFLDIACFFVGKDKDYVMSILKECRFFPIDGIHTLMKRSLVGVRYDNKLSMHNLLRDMGRDIVRRESPNDPGLRSRIWQHEEAIEVLEDETGTRSVEGLILNLPELSDSFRTEAFEMMKVLRLLQLNYVHVTGSFEYISRKLLWLCWHGFPLASVPADLHLRNLVALDMRYSHLKQFSMEVKVLKKLKFLNLSHSHELLCTPDFGGMLNLEKLLLKDCINLAEVHASIGCLASLIFLNMKNCKSLEHLPRSICDLGSLENFNLLGCSNLEELPEDLGNMKSLVVLIADGTAIRSLPDSIGNLRNLKHLSLQECFLLSSPSRGQDSHVIAVLPTALQMLDLRYCNLSDDMIPHDIQLPLLNQLRLCGNNFTNLPVSIGRLPRLAQLSLNECKRLESVPLLQSSLMSFQAQNCSSLESVNFVNYEVADLQLKGCHKLKDIKGYFNLETVGVEPVEKLLQTCGLVSEESIAGRRMHMVNTLTETHTITPIQALCERGIYSIFLPCNEIPSWFLHQNEGDTVSFHVPSLHQGSKIIGFVICAIYAWERPDMSCFFFPYITVANKTKAFNWVYESKITFFSTELEQDILWLSYWMFDDCSPKECTDKSDTRWIFRDEMETGDQINVTIEFGYGILVRKCGVHVLFQCDDKQDSQSSYFATVASATSRHGRRFLQSKPHWLTLNSSKEITLRRYLDSNLREPYVNSYSSYYQRMMQRRTEGGSLKRN